MQQHGWDASVLTLDPAFYRHSIQKDEGLVARVDPRVAVVHTGAFRGLAAILRWRQLLRGRRAPAIKPGSSTGDRRAVSESRGWRAWRRSIANNLFAFPDDEAGWLWPAVWRGLRIVKRDRIDVVLTSAPPFTTHLIGHALRSMTRVPWIADFRDPWARTPWGKRGSARAHQWLESRVIARADAVLLNTPELHREFVRWYGAATASKLHVVTNGYDVDVLEPYARALPAAPPPLVLTHAGNLYGARDPRPLLEALARCIRNGDIPRDGVRLNLVGKVGPAYDIEKAVGRLGLQGTVVGTPPVAHEESLRTLARSHVLVVIQPDTALQVPAKLYEYIGLKRCILALAEDGAVARIVRDGGFGTVVPPADVDAIATALVDLYRQRDDLVRRSVDNPRVAQFDARSQSAILTDVLSDLSPTPAAPAGHPASSHARLQ